jgi:hypothetical protein
MAAQDRKWESVSELTPEIREKINHLNSRTPIATVELRIYSTRKGDSEAQVDLPSAAPFTRSGASVADAYQVIAGICQREIRSALAALVSTASEIH